LKASNESQLVTACLQLLHVAGIFAWRQNNVGIYDPSRKVYRKSKTAMPGVSDLLGIYKGRFLAIECKVGKNKVSEEQSAFLLRVQKEGGVALVCYSLDDLEAWMRDEGVI
jgi:penicillin-binding protein-related factor A (putative recombinase)